jgi:undecaprenyl-diphosphatase
MLDNLVQPIVLGVTQGLGEFLPISSTAHLILAPYFFHWPDPGLSFDVALHFGTLIAVLAYFWRDIIFIFKLASKNNNWRFPLPSDGSDFQKIFNDSISINRNKQYNSKTLWFLIIATIPGVIAGYFLENKAETVFRNPLIIALTLSVFGLILYLADRYIKHKKSINKITVKDSIIIGLSQAIAIIPGVSRSGATITAGLIRGLDRTSAARFSFLLSAPIIFGAAVFKMPILLKSGINIDIILGIFFSAISGYFAIKYLLQLVEKAGYRIFFWYRIMLALLIIFTVVLS